MAFGSAGLRVIGCAVVALLCPIAVCVPLMGGAPEPALDVPFVAFVLFEGCAALLALAFLAPGRIRWVDRALAVVLAVIVAEMAAATLRSSTTFLGWAGRLVLVLAVGTPALRFALRETDETGAYGAPAGESLSGAADGGAPPDEPSVGAVFAEKLAWLVATQPDLVHEGEVAPSGWGRMVFPKLEDDGFDVVIVVEREAVTVSAGTFAHMHFCGDVAADPARSALGWLRALLGPDARLRERLSGGEPYVTRIERRTPEGWRTAFIAGKLAWNYLGRRSERILVNRRGAPAPWPDPVDA
jgi:hypothetical protein